MKSSHLKIINTIARVGYSAKCVVYCILGGLILFAAFRTATTDEVSKETVFREILTSPFGSISLTIMIIGLSCYIIWRLVQGITNPDNLDITKPNEVILRVFYFGSAIVYTSVTYAAVKVLLGRSDNSSSQDSKQMSSSILQEEWGVVLIGIISLIIMLFALIQFKHTIKGDFMDKFVNSMPGTKKHLANGFGRAGFAGRGVIYFMVGGFFMHAAMTYDSNKAGGMSEALQTLLEQPFGPYLVALVGVGMFSFGVFCGFEGRYRKTS
ncbi:DUF1206 domain-containing protein [Aliiglaciecola lipolytica]|uniref:DUF1206 domain-containing protein n=1 Tax=Aliiglaciecola lipolytica TaxID=477689 RepID=UPI0002FD5EF5|nr:DUF1206 domain-containing protein [Aliiglaciecola lipolytica]